MAKGQHIYRCGVSQHQVPAATLTSTTAKWGLKRKVATCLATIIRMGIRESWCIDMENVFKQTGIERHNAFKWDNLGDIKDGRGHLGEDVPVLIYRLMQYTMLDVITRDFGLEKSDEIFRASGFLAGKEFAANTLDLSVEFDVFLANLQAALEEYRIGILRMEEFDDSTGSITLTIGQDLDCSGLPITNETVCTYDEGFVAGVLNEFTGKEYDVREIDCWASGNRTCRFRGMVVNTRLENRDKE